MVYKPTNITGGGPSCVDGPAKSESPVDGKHPIILLGFFQPSQIAAGFRWPIHWIENRQIWKIEKQK